MKIGILGGTFDPPHNGHLIVAEQARVQLKLDEVWFAPAGQPVHKQGHRVTPAAQRVAMVQRAIQGNPFFKLCLTDVERAPPHYSVDLIKRLHQLHPHNEWRFLVGADSLQDLSKWHEPAELVSLIKLGVAHRPGYEPNVSALEHVIPHLRERIEWLHSPLVYVSSSDLRSRARQGLPLRYVVPDNVVNYIAQQKIY